MALENQRHRVVRRSWGTDADGLAQELSAILASDVEPKTGKIAVNLRSENAPTREFEFPTQSSLNLPVIDVDEPIAADTVRTDEIMGETNGAEKTITSNRTWKVRTAFLGQVVSFQSGDSTYTINLYPNLPGGTSAEVVQVTGVVPLHSGGGAGDEVTANRWVTVFRVTTCRSTTLTFNTDTETVGKSNEISIDSQKHYFINEEFIHDDVTMPGDLTILDNNQLFFRDAQLYIQSSSNGNLTVEADDGINLSINGTTQLRVVNDNLIFNAGANDPTFDFATNNVLNMTAGKLYISSLTSPALEVDSAVQFDGAIDANSSIDVNLTSDLHGAVKCYSSLEIDGALDHDGPSVGFFGVAPVTQRTNIGVLSNSGGGSVTGDIVNAAPSSVIDETKLLNNFANVIDRLNKIEQVLQDLGLTT